VSIYLCPECVFAKLAPTKPERLLASYKSPGQNDKTFSLEPPHTTYPTLLQLIVLLLLFHGLGSAGGHKPDWVQAGWDPMNTNLGAQQLLPFSCQKNVFATFHPQFSRSTTNWTSTAVSFQMSCASMIFFDLTWSAMIFYDVLFKRQFCECASAVRWTQWC
jgi:hypothetical protein